MPDFNPDEYLSSGSEFNPDSYLGLGDNQEPTSSIPQSANNIDVPGMGSGGPESFAQEKDRSVGEVLEGAVDTALTIGTGITGGALGFGAGTVGGIIGELTGMLKPGEGLELAEKLGSMLTREPRSEAGKEYVENIGETLGVLPPVGLAGGVTPKFGLPNIEKPNLNLLSVKDSLLGKAIAEKGSERVKKSFTKKLGNYRFEPRIFGMVKEARKQGFDDGMTTVIANASPMNKRKMLKQVKVQEIGMGDYLYQQKNRPSDIAGDSFLRQVDFVRHNNQQAGQQLNRVAKSLKGKEVDVTETIDKFFNDLTGMGVKLDADGNLDFTGSLIEFSAPAKTLIANTLTKIKRNPVPDALEAHKFKKFLDEDLQHGKKQEGGVSGAVERVLGSLRS